MAEFDADGEQRRFEDTVQEWQDSIESNVRKIGKGSWARILRMARKPSKKELDKFESKDQDKINWSKMGF